MSWTETGSLQRYLWACPQSSGGTIWKIHSTYARQSEDYGPRSHISILASQVRIPRRKVTRKSVWVRTRKPADSRLQRAPKGPDVDAKLGPEVKLADSP